MTAETENTIPTAEIVEIVETDEETAKRAEREEKERRERRYALAQQIRDQLDRLTICFDMLLDTDPKDKAGFESIARRMRVYYSAALELVPEHREYDGEYYDLSMHPFRRLYTR